MISAQQAAATARDAAAAAAGPPAGPKRSLLPWLLVVLFLVVAGGIGLVVYHQLRGNQVTVPQRPRPAAPCAAAQAQLDQAGLNGKCTDATSTNAEQGRYSRPTPTGGSSVDKNSVVTHLRQRRTDAQRQLPDVTGKSAADADRRAALAAGLHERHDQTRTSSTRRPSRRGDVVSTNAEAGHRSATSTQRSRSTVAIGNVTVPDVAGLNCNQAQQKLQAQTLNGTCTRTNSTDAPVTR